MNYNHRLTVGDETRAERIEHAAVELYQAAEVVHRTKVTHIAKMSAAIGKLFDKMLAFDAARRGET